jgi:hypothetical protein
MKFVRSLPREVRDELKKLADSAQPNWWQEIQRNADLHVAVRENYLNVYTNGQSVFKIALDPAAPVTQPQLLMSTHYKYLLKPNMPSKQRYAKFNGKQFLLAGKPAHEAKVIQDVYKANETIAELISTACSYSGPEKRGVHSIARQNSHVIDLEVAFSKEREPSDPTAINEDEALADQKTKSTAPRIDLVALHADGGDQARLVFYEVKRFADARLAGSKPKVLDQLKKYDHFLTDHQDDITIAYKNVCNILLALSTPSRPVPKLIAETALRRKIVVDPVCRLVIFGYYASQQKRIKELESLLPDRIIARGSTKGLKLTV